MNVETDIVQIGFQDKPTKTQEYIIQNEAEKAHIFGVLTALPEITIEKWYHKGIDFGWVIKLKVLMVDRPYWIGFCSGKRLGIDIARID